MVRSKFAEHSVRSTVRLGLPGCPLLSLGIRVFDETWNFVTSHPHTQAPKVPLAPKYFEVPRQSQVRSPTCVYRSFIRLVQPDRRFYRLKIDIAHMLDMEDRPTGMAGDWQHRTARMGFGDWR